MDVNINIIAQHFIAPMKLFNIKPLYIKKITERITMSALWEINVGIRDCSQINQGLIGAITNKMLTEINLAALVSIENFEDKKELEKIILVKVPLEVYPTLYKTFINLFEQAGLKDIKMEKDVDFEKMYNEKKKS